MMNEIKDKLKRLKYHRLNHKDLLDLLSKQHPTYNINWVDDYKLNEYGFYEVHVDMQQKFFETTILHTKKTLYYPYDKYNRFYMDH